MSAPAARRRRPVALVVLDLAGSAFVLLFTAVLGLSAGTVVAAFPNAWLLVLCAALLVAAWAASLAMAVIRAVQRRWSWYWPVLGGVAIVVVLWAGTLLQSALL